MSTTANLTFELTLQQRNRSTTPPPMTPPRRTRRSLVPPRAPQRPSLRLIPPRRRNLFGGRQIEFDELKTPLRLRHRSLPHCPSKCKSAKTFTGIPCKLEFKMAFTDTLERVSKQLDELAKLSEITPMKSLSSVKFPRPKRIRQPAFPGTTERCDCKLPQQPEGETEILFDFRQNLPGFEDPLDEPPLQRPKRARQPAFSVRYNHHHDDDFDLPTEPQCDLLDVGYFNF
jgi:hypothetical protein